MSHESEGQRGGRLDSVGNRLRRRERGEERAQKVTARDPHSQITEDTRLILSLTLTPLSRPSPRDARAACGDDGAIRSGKALTTGLPDG